MSFEEFYCGAFLDARFHAMKEICMHYQLVLELLMILSFELDNDIAVGNISRFCWFVYILIRVYFSIYVRLFILHYELIQH